jgi:hypothetical protein
MAPGWLWFIQALPHDFVWRVENGIERVVMTPTLILLSSDWRGGLRARGCPLSFRF